MKTLTCCSVVDVPESEDTDVLCVVGVPKWRHCMTCCCVVGVPESEDTDVLLVYQRVKTLTCCVCWCTREGRH